MSAVLDDLAGPYYRFVNAMAADGYDHASDGTLPIWFNRMPGWLILILRPCFSLSVPGFVRQRGVRAWRSGFQLGLAERAA